MVCSMTACSFSSLTSACVDAFNVIVPAEKGSSLSPRPLNGVSNIPCDDKEQEKKSKVGMKRCGEDCPALQVANGMSFVTGRFILLSVFLSS